MIEKNHPEVGVRRQCALLEVNRNRLEKRPKLDGEDKEIMRDLDEVHTRWPFYGQQQTGSPTLEARLPSGSQASPSPHEIDGDGGGCSETEDEHPGQRTSEISLSFTKSDGGSARPGVVHRHHLHSAAEGLRLPCGGDGLAYSLGIVVAYLEHLGHFVLSGSSARSAPNSGLLT